MTGEEHHEAVERLHRWSNRVFWGALASMLYGMVGAVVTLIEGRGPPEHGPPFWHVWLPVGIGGLLWSTNQQLLKRAEWHLGELHRMRCKIIEDMRTDMERIVSDARPRE